MGLEQRPPGRRAAAPGSRSRPSAWLQRSARRCHRPRGRWGQSARPWPSGRRSSAARAPPGGPEPPGSLGRAWSWPSPRPPCRASAGTAARRPPSRRSAQAGPASGSRSWWRMASSARVRQVRITLERQERRFWPYFGLSVKPTRSSPSRTSRIGRQLMSAIKTGVSGYRQCWHPPEIFTQPVTGFQVSHFASGIFSLQR
jgi:hypothetical protein